MFKWLKRTKYKSFSEIVKYIENGGIIKNNGRCHYYIKNDFSEIKDWEFDFVYVEVGTHIEIVECHMKDNIHYREKYEYTV